MDGRGAAAKVGEGEGWERVGVEVGRGRGEGVRKSETGAKEEGGKWEPGCAQGERVMVQALGLGQEVLRKRIALSPFTKLSMHPLLTK